MELPMSVKLIALAVADAGGRAYVVGGAVRDHLLGIEPKDFDVEVYGLQVEAIEAAVESAGFEVDACGRAFGVLKVKHEEIDISIPRRDNKVSKGHKGFVVEGDPTMSPKEAAYRRDYSMNSVAWSPYTGQLVDPYNGLADIESRTLRHTSESFSEDPLRVLRGMQFAARFDLDVAPETIEVCKGLDMGELHRERIREEWLKLILKGRKPSKGLKFLRDTGWIRFFPEIEALIGVEQDPEWHPEGDVFEHTCQSLDASVAITQHLDDYEKTVVRFAVLCHDFGKPETTEFVDGRIRSRGHEPAGAAPTRTFLERLFRSDNQKRDPQLIEDVIPLVKEHLAPSMFYDQQVSHSAVRRLAKRVSRIDLLCLVSLSDRNGRGALTAGSEKEAWLMEQAAAVAAVDSKPKPILQGRDLIANGMKPGPGFKQLLDAAYEAQLDGIFSDVESGIEWLKQQ